MTEAEKAYQYFVIAVPENEEQAKAYFWARKALRITLTPPNEWVSRVQELDELYTKLQIVTGFTAEQLLEMFAAGYTPEKTDYSKHFEAMANLAESDPPNEWVRVEDEIPSDDDDGLEFFCMTNATGKCGGVLPLEWEVATVRGKTVRRWKWRSRISPWAVTHWMKRPAPPGENNNVPTKAPNEPLTIEQLREMEDPVWCACKTVEGFEGFWCLCNHGYILTPARQIFDVKEIPHWVFYRRPPEGEANETK